jgi:hypothetical protein
VFTSTLNVNMIIINIFAGAADRLIQLLPQCSLSVSKEICWIFSFLTAKEDNAVVEYLLAHGLLQVWNASMVLVPVSRVF